jgi:hypothetical protein
MNDNVDLPGLQGPQLFKLKQAMLGDKWRLPTRPSLPIRQWNRPQSTEAV